MVVKSKTTGGRSIQAGTWTFSYDVTTDNRFIFTTINAPNSIEEYKHHKVNHLLSLSPLDRDFLGDLELWKVGLLAEKAIKAKTTGNPVLRKEVYTYDKRIMSDEVYEREPYTRDNNGFKDNFVYQHFLTCKVITLDGSNYTTTYEDYSDNVNPHKITETGQNTKIRLLTYYPRNNRQNIVGLTKDTKIGATLSEGNNTNRKIIRTFDSKGNLKTENRFGVLSKYSYDAKGNMESEEDANGNNISYSNFKLGVARRTVMPEGVVTTSEVDDFGNTTRITDGEGHVTRYAYDGLNRLTSVDKPIGDDISVVWTTSMQTINRGGYQRITSFDGLGREICSNTSGVRVGFSYDAVGNQTHETYPSFTSCSNVARTRYQHDALNRITRTTHPDNSFHQVRFLSGNRQEITDERNHKFISHYRAFGEPETSELIRVTGPLNLNYVLARNILGQVTSINRNGFQRTYNYGSSYFLQSALHPETGTTVFGRDNVGNLTSKRVATSLPTLYGYDDLNRLTQVDYPGSTPDVIRTYDKNSQLKTVNSGLADITYTYDENKNLISERQQIDGRTYFYNYSYDGRDFLSSVTNPDNGIVEYAPNNLGWPTKAAPFVTNVTYNAAGQPKLIEFANGRKQTHTYDVRLWPDVTAVDGGISDKKRSYDKLGNLETIDDRLNNQFDRVMTYDALNRLKNASGPWGSGVIDYNAVDDIRSKQMGISQLNYVYSGGKISSVSGIANFITAANYDYDVYGNIIQKANNNAGWYYDYDHAPNLRSVKDHTQNVIREYDYSGLRHRVRSVKSTETRIHIVNQAGQVVYEEVKVGSKPNITNIYLGNRLVAELESAGTTLPATVFGWGFGNSAHKFSYSRTFTVEAGYIEAQYCVAGYAIDTNTEVSVEINSVQVGYLRAGLNGTQTCFDLSEAALQIGSNTITFRQQNPVQTWGVSGFEYTEKLPLNPGSLVPILDLMLEDNTQGGQ